jgi:hypothetical protein
MSSRNFSYSVGIDVTIIREELDEVIARVDMNGCAIGILRATSFNRGDEDVEVEYKIFFQLGSDREIELNPVFVMVVEDCVADWLMDDYPEAIWDEVSYQMNSELDEYFYDLESDLVDHLRGYVD